MRSYYDTGICVWVDGKGIYTLIPRSVYKAKFSSEKIRIKSGDTVSA